jgi:hypothetical protein
MMDPLAPPPIIPMPAARYGRLRGRRVIIGVPGAGFRGDLRADDSVVQGSRTFVPVLTEQEYYRAELHHIEAFAILVPIERAWAEEPGWPTIDYLQPLDAPPMRHPVRIESAGALLGRRLIQTAPDGFVRDLRAVSDGHVSHAGLRCVRVCAESGWYDWALTGTTPTTVEMTLDQLWVE